MRRYWLPTLITAVAGAFIVLLAIGLSAQGENLSLDSQIAHGHYPMAPDATVKLPLLGTSRTASIADFRGRVVIINIFAGWCDTCQAEGNLLHQEQARLAPRHATILGITYMDDSADAENYMRTYDLHYPVLRDVSGSVVRSFGTNALPESFVLDSAGRIVAISRGEVTAQWLHSAVDKAFAMSA
jgi:cytochrome c biogenesis protein CcmG/thiol:disulfide interchange protein DsbE